MSFKFVPTKKNIIDRQRMEAAMQYVGDQIVAMVVRKIESNQQQVTGTMKNSIISEVNNMALSVGSTIKSGNPPYPYNVEFGSKPHSPPFSDILNWVSKKGLARKMAGKQSLAKKEKKLAWAIVRKIQKHGTEGNSFFMVVIDNVKYKIAENIARKYLDLSK